MQIAEQEEESILAKTLLKLIAASASGRKPQRKAQCGGRCFTKAETDEVYICSYLVSVVTQMESCENV